MLFKLLKHIVLIPIALIFAFPFAWMLFGVFKTNNEIWQKPYQLFPENWDIVSVIEAIPSIKLGQYIFNSISVGIFGSLLMILVATLFVYVVVFMESPITRVLFALSLAIYMLPGAVTYVPSYVILARMQLLDSLNGLVFSNLASIFSVFYLRQSFKKMSYEYFEAARIDGASHMKIIRHVIFPLNKSAFTTLFVLTFVSQYNNYMWPSIMLKSQKNYLVSQGLRQFFIQEGAYGMNWSEVMLASSLSILPVLLIFIVGQKWLITGVMQESGLK